MILFLLAWGGLASCLAVALGLTIRNRDRQVPTEVRAVPEPETLPAVGSWCYCNACKASRVVGWAA